MNGSGERLQSGKGDVCARRSAEANEPRSEAVDACWNSASENTRRLSGLSFGTHVGRSGVVMPSCYTGLVLEDQDQRGSV
jgi:hypothetical protein